MSAEGKAKKFAVVAEQHGWEIRIDSKNDDEVHVNATRGPEKIYIWWRGNSLIETPKYMLNGSTISLHNAAGATRQLGLKPDLNRAFRRRRTVITHTEVAIPERMALPFDLDESPKSEILKAIRGNTLVWLNSRTGLAEKSHVPYKVSSGGGVRLFNVDLKNVFYIRSGTDGRRYVSFMDANGTFRAVYLDAILQVV